MRGIASSHHPSSFLLSPRKSTPRPTSFHTSKFLKFYYTYSQFYSICSAPLYSSLIYPTHFHTVMGARNKSHVPHALPSNCILYKLKIQCHDLKKSPNQPQNKTPHNCLLPYIDMEGASSIKERYTGASSIKGNAVEKPQGFLITLRLV